MAAIAGPFGTYSALHFGTRLFYWATIIGISVLVGRSVRVVVEEQFRHRPAWMGELISLSTMVPILTAIIWVASPQLLMISAQKMPRPEILALYVLAVAGTVAALRLTGIVERRPSDDMAVGPSSGPRLSDRLPDEFQAADIFRLSGRDHHVEVVTSVGTVTIRKRFADAIQEMDPVKGYCAHRSHWVAKEAIIRVEREKAKIFLCLVNGDRVPVSRKYKPGLEEAGIL